MDLWFFIVIAMTCMQLFWKSDPCHNKTHLEKTIWNSNILDFYNNTVQHKVTWTQRQHSSDVDLISNSSSPQQWASCQIRKIAGAHAPGMPGTFSPSPQVSDPDMHHGTCVTHVPWCMPGLLTSSFLWNRRRGKTFPAFPAHAQPAILRIW